MAIFAEITENERIIDRHLHGIHPLLDYDASESQSVLSIWSKYGFSVRPWFQYYAAVARSLRDS